MQSFQYQNIRIHWSQCKYKWRETWYCWWVWYLGDKSTPKGIHSVLFDTRAKKSLRTKSKFLFEDVIFGTEEQLTKIWYFGTTLYLYLGWYIMQQFRVIYPRVIHPAWKMPSFSAQDVSSRFLNPHLLLRYFLNWKSSNPVWNWETTTVVSWTIIEKKMQIILSNNYIKIWLAKCHYENNWANRVFNLGKKSKLLQIIRASCQWIDPIVNTFEWKEQKLYFFTILRFRIRLMRKLKTEI